MRKAPLFVVLGLSAVGCHRDAAPPAKAAAITLLPHASPVAARPDGDFRSARWGESPGDVEAIEGKPALADSTSLLYPISVAGLKGDALFRFADGRLTSAGYVLTQNHSEPGKHIDDYNQIKELLEAKYGSGKEGKDWRNSLYKSDPSQWGIAILAGHLTLLTQWETPRTKIALVLSGDNFKPNLGVGYKSKELGALEERQAKAKAAKGL